MELDGCIPEAAEVLTDEEYFSQVGFDQRLLSIFNLVEKDGTYYWPINSRQGYIQKGRFRPENSETGHLEWAIIYEHYADTPGLIFINFGDLLVHIPVVDRRIWKQHFREIRSPPPHAERLLFFENEEELKDAMDDWKRRNEESDLPWLTTQENEQLVQEIHYLKGYDREENQWRDLRTLEFKIGVLDKYRDNELCEINTNYISFLRKDKKKSVSDVSFTIKDEGRIIMVLAKDFIFVPPRERKHWEQYQIESSSRHLTNSL